MKQKEKETVELNKDTVLVPQEESVRIQYVKQMKENIVSQRKAEEELLERMMEEQRIVDELNKSLDENLCKTVELRKYNQEVKAHMENQVYRMNGVTPDKMEGMKNYRKAFYIGSAFSIFVLSVVMVAITGITHGFQSELCLFLAYFTALEGAVLITETKRIWIVKAIFRVIYFLLFPAMMVIFVCYELGYPEYDRFLPYFSMAGMVIFILAMISYFVYDPYRKDKVNIRKAKDQMKDIQRAAEKSVRKNRRAIEKKERREERRAARQEARAKKQAEKEKLEREWGTAEKEEIAVVPEEAAKTETAVVSIEDTKMEKNTVTATESLSSEMQETVKEETGIGLETKTEAGEKTESGTEAKNETGSEIETKTDTEAKNETGLEIEIKTDTEAKNETESEIKLEAQAETETNLRMETGAETVETGTEIKARTEEEAAETGITLEETGEESEKQEEDSQKGIIKWFKRSRG